MINTLQNLPKLCDLMAKKTNRSPKTISRLASGSGETITRLRDGKPITVQRAERMLTYFSDNWPEGVKWPKNVDRPKPTKSGGRK